MLSYINPFFRHNITDILRRYQFPPKPASLGALNSMILAELVPGFQPSDERADDTALFEMPLYRWRFGACFGMQRVLLT